MGSTANDECLDLSALTAPVSEQSTAKVVACQSGTANLELRAGGVVSAGPGWQVHWLLTGSGITLFVPVLVRGSVLNCKL